jgi:hypothetical protein
MNIRNAAQKLSSCTADFSTQSRRFLKLRMGDENVKKKRETKINK